MISGLCPRKKHDDNPFRTNWEPAAEPFPRVLGLRLRFRVLGFSVFLAFKD